MPDVMRPASRGDGRTLKISPTRKSSFNRSRVRRHPFRLRAVGGVAIGRRWATVVHPAADLDARKKRTIICRKRWDTLISVKAGETPMREQVEARLAALRREYTVGETQLRREEQQVNSLRETLIRISGAILVLEELLSATTPDASAIKEQQPEDCLAIIKTQADQVKI